MGKNNSRETVEFEKHQPERRRAGGRLYCNGGCCCCSCCLHSLGGLIAATVVSAKSKSPAEGSVAGCYWTVLAVLGMLFLICASTSSPASGLLAALFCLPLVQLVASLLTLIWVETRSESLEDKKAGRRMLGKITFWSFVWALAGVLLMVAGFSMLG
jgi:hypothetical protein